MAKTHRDRAFASLNHVLDLEWMLEAYRTTRKDGAAGLDLFGQREVAKIERRIEAGEHGSAGSHAPILARAAASPPH